MINVNDWPFAMEQLMTSNSAPANAEPANLPPIVGSLCGLLRNHAVSEEDYLRYLEQKYLQSEPSIGLIPLSAEG